MSMHELYFLILYFFIYAFLGWCVEVAFVTWQTHHFVNRGFLNGPICPVYGFGVCAVILFLTPFRSNLLLLYITSMVLVSAIEGLTGFLLEKLFHTKWWDYSDMPLNLKGYICLPISLVWGVACVVVIRFVHPVIHGLLSHIPMAIGVILIVIMAAAMFSDLCITVSGILKMNKRLETMQEIADELHQISDKLGENIYKSTVFAMEKQEDMKEKQEALRDSLTERHEEFKESLAERQEEFYEKLDDVSDDIREHIQELRTRYAEMTLNTTPIQKRILKAFPKMKSRGHKEILEDLRERLRELEQKRHNK